MIKTHKMQKVFIHSYGLTLFRSYGLLALLLFFTTGLFAQTNPSFYYQWGLKNDGTFPYYATENIDINAVEAWKVTKGSPEIRIAILDELIQTDHPDLTDNILHELVYDACPGGVESYRGTAWAGIIAAKDIGIVGVAPNCKIVPIRINDLYPISECNKGFQWTEDIILANAIRYAWETAKADIIVLPWGGDYPDGWYYINEVDTELLNAVTLGRGGRGCVIVAAAGQWNKYMRPGYVDWPARLPYVMGVGAMAPDGGPELKSEFGGNFLDVVAPGYLIWTTKNNNAYGWKPDMIPGGASCSTEAACSFVSGIAALMLSVNPCLTQEEVRNIIALSCRKVVYEKYPVYYTFFPSHKYGSWNNRMGYGLPDSYKALVFSLSMPETFDVPGKLKSISNPLTLSIKNDWNYYDTFPDFPPYQVENGTYNVKRHEVTATVQFKNNYPLPPLVQGIANGFSDNTLQNDGRCFMEVVNVMETDATVRTYVYEVINPGHIKWIPTHPDSVRFHIAVMRDNLHNELFLQNEVEPTTKNYTAITTIAAGKNVTSEKPIGDYVIESGGSVGLQAGESITLADGFHAQAGSFFKTHIEPFFICDHKAPAPVKSGENELQYVISDYTVEKTGVDKVVRDYMKIYPNPSAGEVTIEYNLSLSELVEITLHDNSGKLVYKLRNRTPHEAGVYKITFSGVELPNGFYLCTLKTETGQKTEKLIIAK